MASLFGGVAAGYATARPPVHPLIIDRLEAYLRVRGTVTSALDVGCGAGLSTRALKGLARLRIGIEPVEPMLAWSRNVDPGATFVVANAESLPVRSGSVDLITAAGSLNYVNLDAFFPEAVRVLSSGGVLAVYDFSQGTRAADSDALEVWFAEFRRRYPPPPGHGQPLDPGLLAALPSGFIVDASEGFEVAIPMTETAYLDYVMTETNVAHAASRGEPAERIREWCDETLQTLFGSRSLDVLFPAWLACMLPHAANL